jgi:hypothetical protein
MTLVLFFTSTVIAGVISGIISQGAPWWREWLSNGKAADFSALRLALMLEEFAGQCAEVHRDVESTIYVNGEGPRVGLPSLPEYPADIAWHALGTRLTEKVLGFRVARADAGAEIMAAWEDDPGPPEDRNYIVAVKAVEIGLAAFAVAEHLRTKRKLSPAYPAGKWNTKDDLTERAAVIAEQQRVYEQSRAASHAAMVASFNASAAPPPPSS